MGSFVLVWRSTKLFVANGSFCSWLCLLTLSSFCATLTSNLVSSYWSVGIDKLRGIEWLQMYLHSLGISGSVAEMVAAVGVTQASGASEVWKVRWRLPTLTLTKPWRFQPQILAYLEFSSVSAEMNDKAVKLGHWHDGNCGSWVQLLRLGLESLFLLKNLTSKSQLSLSVLCHEISRWNQRNFIN